jgi:hypothetical protein
VKPLRAMPAIMSLITPTAGSSAKKAAGVVTNQK